MNDRQEFDLLSDVAKLLRKYGPDAFESLARSLSTPEFAERLASILTTVAAMGRAAGARQVTTTERSRASRDFRSSLIEMGKSEPEKSAMLVEFYDDLLAKKVLPTLRDIQAFASTSGLSVPKAKARDKAIAPLVRGAMQLPVAELAPVLSTAKRATSQDDRSLEGWSNIILEKSRRQKPQ